MITLLSSNTCSFSCLSCSVNTDETNTEISDHIDARESKINAPYMYAYR